ncbi:dipeptidase [Corticibacterium sp. UT-5YL-CI-8]|nr:dipeptidase [Tianweitania sp. UT-5YL-CI-8]
MTQRVFDGHNDVLCRMWLNKSQGGSPVEDFAGNGRTGHIDAVRAKAGGLVGGICAIYVPSPRLGRPVSDANGHYNTPKAEPLEHGQALAATQEMFDIARDLDEAGVWIICRSTGDIRAAAEQGLFAAIVHIEGCEGISTGLEELDGFYEQGLRSLGPVWSRDNVFAHGVPFAFPMSPDTGEGLTSAGFDLIRRCDELGILVDLAHITEKGFWDVAKTSSRPLVASHSNAHALTPVARNLTDRQLEAIRHTSGLVGVNFATSMLRADGQNNSNTPMSDVVRHVNYLVEKVGIDCVALGSDFDGALIPREIGDAAGLPKLVCALRDAGYDDGALEKLCFGNWMRVLDGVLVD